MILDLKNETIWSGFSWYLAAPPGKEYVHEPSIANSPIIVNNWFCSPLFLGLLKFRGHIGNLALGRMESKRKIVSLFLSFQNYPAFENG